MHNVLRDPADRHIVRHILTVRPCVAEVQEMVWQADGE